MTMNATIVESWEVIF